MDYSTIYPHVTDCFQLEKQINIIKNDIDFYYTNLNDKEGNRRKEILDQKIQLFNLLKCPQKVENARVEAYTGILDKYSDIAKTRIESQSKTTRNGLILIGAITIGVSFYLILNSNKK